MFTRIAFRLFTLPVMLLMLAAPVHAADLHSAKAQGLIGEQANGYLGLVKSSAPADVKELVSDINSKRRQTYQDIAKRNNTTLAAVEALAGKKAIEKTPSGQYVQPAGTWIRK